MKRRVVSKKSWHYRFIYWLASDYKRLKLMRESDTCEYLQMFFWACGDLLVRVTAGVFLLAAALGLTVVPVIAALQHFGFINPVLNEKALESAMVLFLIYVGVAVLAALQGIRSFMKRNRNHSYLSEGESSSFLQIIRLKLDKICEPIKFE